MLPTKYMRLNYCCKNDYKVKKCVVETHTKGIVYNGDKLIDNNGRFRCVDGPFFSFSGQPFPDLHCIAYLCILQENALEKKDSMREVFHREERFFGYMGW